MFRSAMAFTISLKNKCLVWFHAVNQGQAEIVVSEEKVCVAKTIFLCVKPVSNARDKLLLNVYCYYILPFKPIVASRSMRVFQKNKKTALTLI